MIYQAILPLILIWYSFLFQIVLSFSLLIVVRSKFKREEIYNAAGKLYNLFILRKFQENNIRLLIKGVNNPEMNLTEFKAALLSDM